MNYTNKQIADQIAKILNDLKADEKTSFVNGVMTYNGKEYTIPNINSPKRNTYLQNR